MMDIGNSFVESRVNMDRRKRQLPSDLPTSLDDRKSPHGLAVETEIYDAWQGQTQYISNPVRSSPLAFSLSLEDDAADTNHFAPGLEGNDRRLTEMLAVQAAHREESSAVADEEAIARDTKLSHEAKRGILQKSLHMAASNGDMDQVHRLVKGPAKEYIDVDAADEEGTAPLIYASCFGHQDVVEALLEVKAMVDRQDRNQWTALMWAMTNRHKEIAKLLLEHGASPDVKSSSGRTAFDFAAPNSEMADYLNDNGYHIGDAGVSEDFYDTGLSQDRFEQEMEENEMKRRMMMESSMNLEVDLSSLGMDERPESPDDIDDHQDFVWDRCLNDQMFVFQENELDRILDIIITCMDPQRTPSQKPVPANILFLSARYAHYHASHDLLTTLLVSAMDKINNKVERHQWDMTVLAFWMSNATLLLHYLKKDAGLAGATTEFQLQLVDLINEIFILIIRDAERRMDKVLDVAMLDHETIPGFEEVQFANDWNIFRSKNKAQVPEPISIRPQASNRKAHPSPRNITSLLSSTLFVLDLYDIHSVITAQILAQLFYWIGAELFNHILSRRIYLARTKAMQIRMNISTLEDWARNNNRSPEHYENGSLTTSGETTVEAARKHLMPAVQLLQWLQCFSSLGEDPAALDNTLKQLTRLNYQTLLHAAANYRCEIGEKGLHKASRRHLQSLQMDLRRRKEQVRRDRVRLSSDQHIRKKSAASAAAAAAAAPSTSSPRPATPTISSSNTEPAGLPSPASIHTSNGIDVRDDDEIESEQLFLDPAHMLQFTLPTSVDLRLSFGAGYGGVNRERERKYSPTVPPEFLAKLDLGGPSGSSSAVAAAAVIDRAEWDRPSGEE